MAILTPESVHAMYPGFPIHPENITLDPEDPAPAPKGRVKVRALHWFMFGKNRRFAYPPPDCPSSWWKGVILIGYTAATTGDYKYFVWAGHWDVDYPGKHIEVVIIDTLKGITKEASVHWRNGSEDILWAESANGYSYALMEPAKEYAGDRWARVVASYTQVISGGRASNPQFVTVNRHDPRPSWWDCVGDEAWEVSQGNQRPGSKRLKNLDTSKGGTRRKGSAESAPVDSGSPKAPAGAKPRKASISANSGTRDTSKPNASTQTLVEGDQTAANEPIMVSSDDEEPAASQVLPKPRRASRRKSSTTTAAIVKAARGPSNGGNRKRRIISGSPDVRQHQKQKTAEVINVDSEWSDDEGLVTSSSPPAPSSPITQEGLESSPVPEQLEPAPQSDPENCKRARGTSETESCDAQSCTDART